MPNSTSEAAPAALRPSRLVRWLGMGLLLVFATGCAQQYDLRVDALRDAEAPELEATDTRYVLEPAREGRGAQDLRFQEAARLLEHTLNAKGYARVWERQDADVLIRYETRMSNPMQATQIRSEPVYYRSMGHSRYVRTPVFNDEGKVVRYVSTRIYSPPRSHFAGYRDSSRHVTLYEKSLYLSAWTLDEELESEREIWTVSVATRDHSSDLRSYLPYLLAAAFPYIGESTEGEVGVRLKANSETVNWVREAR